MFGHRPSFPSVFWQRTNSVWPAPCFNISWVCLFWRGPLFGVVWEPTGTPKKDTPINCWKWVSVSLSSAEVRPLSGPRQKRQCTLSYSACQLCELRIRQGRGKIKMFHADHDRSKVASHSRPWNEYRTCKHDTCADTAPAHNEDVAAWRGSCMT